MAAAPPPIREVELELGNRHGLHLRPATRFAQEAMRWKSEVRVSADGTEVNGKSILMLTSLAAERGTRLRVRAEGEDAADCLAALEALVRSRFGEEPPSAAGETSPAGGA
ncbi:MAG: HPr family phosphocarrier protein [Planctomycetaceae bacterium]|nr:HPr family phosphocarrier protein [Planctomycetaceae bacterium]